MKNKLIVRISQGIGNQLFMYAHAYSLSKRINYDLYIDNTSGYFKKKDQFFLINFYLNSKKKYQICIFYQVNYDQY